MAYADATDIHNSEGAYGQAIVKEMDAHRSDNSGQRVLIHSHPAGQVSAMYFSDGCIALERPGRELPYLTQPESQVEWSLSPSRRPAAKPPSQLRPHAFAA
jgi:hypothetical protein